MEGFNQAGQVIVRPIAGPPFFRHPLCESPKLGAVYLLSAAKDRLKGLPSSYVLIDTISGIDPPERRVGEIPFRAVEAISLGAT